MHLPGKLTISHPSGGGGDYIEIRVEDATSGTPFLALQVSLEAFANAITGRASQDCTLELRGLDNLGKRREVKHERVPYTRVYGAYAQLAKAKALAPFEVDGWRGHASDLGNHHKGSDATGYTVSFTRFVDAE